MSTNFANDEYAHLKELTWRGMALGAVLTVIFTASNVYLGLKVGLTFASSIPAAVISMAVLRFFHGHNILENNMVQTQASAAGTLSSIIFVIPGLLMLGYWNDFPFWQTTFVCIAGGILGVIFTIPLRHVMVVKSDLPYPEGVAAAEILKAGDVQKNEKGEDVGSSGIKEIALGGIFAAIFKFCTDGFRIVADSAGYFFKAGSAVFQIPMGFSMALLGAGYLIGIISGIAILVGLAIAWFLLVPYFTATADPSIFTNASIADVANGIWKNKVRYVGVGTMTIAAVWTLLTLSKPMIEGLVNSFRQMRGAKTAQKPHRTEEDLSAKWMLIVTGLSFVILLITFWHFVAGSSIGTGLAITLVLVCTIMAFLIGFLVAAACGYMAGLVGSSSSPISGIGIISIIVMSLVLLAIGSGAGMMSTDDGQQFMTALALFTTSVVLAISCISNDNLQDLKTGYLVKATPWKQQVALIIGCVVGAFVIAPVLEILYRAYGFTGALPRAGMDEAQALAAPQATLMTQIAKGIFQHNLEWGYIISGIVIGAILIVIDFVLKKANKGALPVLAVGMGIYLPPSINAPIFIGALLSWLVTRHFAKKAKAEGKDVAKVTEAHSRRGTLFSAGLIVGESLIGVIIALIIAVSVTSGGSEAPMALNIGLSQGFKQIIGLLCFIGAMYLLYSRVHKAYKETK